MKINCSSRDFPDSKFSWHYALVSYRLWTPCLPWSENVKTFKYKIKINNKSHCFIILVKYDPLMTGRNQQNSCSQCFELIKIWMIFARNNWTLGSWSVCDNSGINTSGSSNPGCHWQITLLLQVGSDIIKMLESEINTLISKYSISWTTIWQGGMVVSNCQCFSHSMITYK